MKSFFPDRASAVILLLFTLTGCREFTTINRPYQRLLIHDFSIPLRTLLPARDDFPNTLQLRVSGTISQPVTLAVDQLAPDRRRYVVRRDTLAAGTYTHREYITDSYGNNNETELTVMGAPGTTGSLSIEWSTY